MSAGPEEGRVPANGVDDTEALDPVAERLSLERPVPRSGFRGALREQLVSARGLLAPEAPRGLRLLIAAYAGGGAFLLALAAAGLAELGPLAP